jgi:hypothetical protein
MYPSDTWRGPCPQNFLDLVSNTNFWVRGPPTTPCHGGGNVTATSYHGIAAMADHPEACTCRSNSYPGAPNSRRGRRPLGPHGWKVIFTVLLGWHDVAPLSVAHIAASLGSALSRKASTSSGS